MKLNEYTMFQKSQPWGYHPPTVEKAIKEYEVALAQVNDKYIEAKNIIHQLTQRIERLQDELREMHLQMSSLEVPDVEEAVEHYVLDDFKNYKNVDNSFPEPPIINHEENNEVKNKYKESKIDRLIDDLSIAGEDNDNNINDNGFTFKIVQ